MVSGKATLRLALGGITISFSPVFVVLADVGPTISAFYRMSIGGAVLVFVAWAQGTRTLPARRHLIAGGVTGALLALDLALWHRSIQYVGPGMATILGNFQVFFFAGFGVLFLGEQIRPRLLAAIPLSVTGLFLIFGFEERLADTNYRLGIVFGLLTAVSYAAYLIVLRRTRVQFSGETPAATVALFTMVAAVVLGLSGIVEGESFGMPNTKTVLALVGMGVFPQVVGWLLISGAISHVETSRAGLLLLLQPTLAFVWDILFFGRATRLVEYVGVTVALAGIYMGMGGSRRPASTTEPLTADQVSAS